MKMIERARERRRITRHLRAVDRALRTAPTPSMRDEIAFFAQRTPF